MKKEKTVPARSATGFEIRGKMEDRTGWRGQNKSQVVGEEKWQTCWCCREQQRECRMAQVSAEILEHTGPVEKEKVASVPQRESSRQERRSRLSQKEKEQSRESRVPNHEGGGRVKVSESRIFMREREIRARA